MKKILLVFLLLFNSSVYLKGQEKEIETTDTDFQQKLNKKLNVIGEDIEELQSTGSGQKINNIKNAKSIVQINQIINNFPARNLTGELLLGERLRLTNDRGILWADADSFRFLDLLGNELSYYGYDGARIGQIRITTSTLQSTNYSPGLSGFRIHSDGNCEFGDGIFRGTIRATTGYIDGLLEMSATGIMRSHNYSSGLLGRGWQIDPEWANFQNIRARGKITTSVFEKDTISAVNGIVLISKADVLTQDMTSSSTSQLVIGTSTVFAVNEILRIKDGIDDEWFRVSSVSGSTYTVVRDLANLYGGQWKLSTTADFNEGTVSTTSVLIGNDKIYLDPNYKRSEFNDQGNSKFSGASQTQKFYSTRTLYNVNQIGGKISGTGEMSAFTFRLYDVNSGLLRTGTTVYSYAESGIWMMVNIENITLLANTTYVIEMIFYGENSTEWWISLGVNPYPRGYSSYENSRDWLFVVYEKLLDEKYTSPIKYAGDNWISWGIFEENSNGDVIYEVRTATSEATITNTSWSTITNNQVITSTVGAYIQWRSSFSATATPPNTPARDAEIYDVTINIDVTYPTWTKGTAVVSMGEVGKGFIMLDASSDNSPVLQVYKRNSIVYNDYTEIYRVGNLNGYMGISSELWGFATGDYSGNKYIRYDPSNGMIIRGSLYADDITAGTLSVDRIASNSISAEKLNFVVAGATNVIAMINTSSEGITINASKTQISSTVYQNSADISSHTVVLSQHSSSITINAQQIVLRVTQTDYDITTSSYASKLNQHSSEILVNSSSITLISTKAISLGQSTTTLKSEIDVSASNILLRAIKTDVANSTNTLKGEIDVNAGNIALKVSKNDVVNQINISTEGIKIDADNIKISGASEFTDGYDPTIKVSSTGGSYESASSGARVRIFPDANTGIVITSTGGTNVFEAKVGGANAGDVTLGDLVVYSTYTTGAGVQWDEQSHGFIIRGDLYYKQATTRTVSYPAGFFIPRDDTKEYYNDDNKFIRCRTTASTILYIPVSLPNGAVVTSFLVWWYRDDASASGYCNLGRNSFPGGARDVMALANSNSNAGVHSVEDTIIDFATIDNELYTYSIYLSLYPNDSNLDVYCYGAKILYTLIQPLP